MYGKLYWCQWYYFGKLGYHDSVLGLSLPVLVVFNNPIPGPRGDNDPLVLKGRKTNKIITRIKHCQ